VIPLLLVGLFALSAWFTHEAWSSPVNEEAARPPRRWRMVQEFLHRAGLHDVTPRDFVLFSVAAGGLAGLASQLITGWPLVSIVVAGLGAGLPFLWYASLEEGRRAHVQAELADAMGLLRDSIHAGGDVAQGLVSLATYGPALLKPEFQRAVQLMAHGSTLRDALLGMRERLADPVFDTCVATLLLNERLGSPQLTPVLSELAQAVRDELRVQGDLRAQRTRVVASARVIAAIPLVLLVAVRAISPHYLDLFDSVEGQLILGACAASVVIGYQAMRLTSRLPVEQRVLVQ